MVTDKIKVAVRVRPFNKRGKDLQFTDFTPKVILILKENSLLQMFWK